jgi:hypothetical protein
VLWSLHALVAFFASKHAWQQQASHPSPLQ